jgi:hypothetical protein
VATLPDGAVLALAGARAVVYDLNPARWLALTCDIVRRDLSREEWDTHLGPAFRFEATCPARPPA